MIKKECSVRLPAMLEFCSLYIANSHKLLPRISFLIYYFKVITGSK